jgi:hypothetical protein
VLRQIPQATRGRICGPGFANRFLELLPSLLRSAIVGNSYIVVLIAL